MLIPTFSPQGDGNRRGVVNHHTFENEVDPYLFPARGRKPRYGSYCWLSRRRLRVDPYLFPARGRKQGTGVLKHPAFGKRLIPTFSPQGDGNTYADDGNSGGNWC